MKKVLAIVCCLALVFCSSCGKNTLKIEDVQPLVNEEIDLLIKTTDEQNTLLSIIKAGLEITVTDIEETEEGTFAVCDVSNYDSNKILTDFVEANSSRELTNDDFLKEVEAAFSASEKLTTQIKVVVNFDENNTAISVSFTEEQLDILLGGYLDFTQSFIEELKNK